MNATTDIQEMNSTDQSLMLSKLGEHANSLDHLSTSYSINTAMKPNFPKAASCWLNKSQPTIY